MAAELVNRLAILLAARRFPCMGVADSRSLRCDTDVTMHHFVHRTAFVPFRRFSGGRATKFMQRLSLALHDTLGSYLRDALQEGSVDAGTCPHVPRVGFFPFFFVLLGGLRHSPLFFL
jgi:hypothetical protein